MSHPKDKPNETLPQLYLGVIDFDSAIYRCAAVFEHDEESGLKGAKLTLMEFVQNNIVNPTHCEEYLFIVTGQENFRHQLAVSKPYKGQRSADKPLHYLALFDWAIEQFDCLVANDMEADDYAVNCHQKYQGDCVLIGMDKDNLQSAGWHYNFVKNTTMHISQKEAQWSLAFQMLRGDPGDNIPGLQGIGDAKAMEMLTANETIAPMRVVYNEYKARDLLDKYYAEQYALLCMLKDPIIEFERYFTQHEARTEFEAVDDGFEGVDAEVKL